MKHRDLEKVCQIIKSATDLDVVYAFDDLVFPDHSAFLIQFDDQNTSNLFTYFHEDCNPEDQLSILENLTQVCQQEKCTLIPKGAFNLEQKGEEVEIKFIRTQASV